MRTALGFDSRTPAGLVRSPSRHFQTFDLSVWKRLLVARIIARNALLALWVYNPRLFEANVLAAAWGFLGFSGVLFTRSKRTRAGHPAIGTAYSSRKNTEQCLPFKRGNGLPRQDKAVRELIETEVIDAPRQGHSVKQAEAMERLEQLYGDVRRIELFARRYRSGWQGWGDQYAGADSTVPDIVLA